MAFLDRYRIEMSNILIFGHYTIYENVDKGAII